MEKKYKWNRQYMVAIRVLLLPVALILHLIPHITGLIINLYRWVRYGGEFIVYTQDDKPSNQVEIVKNLIRWGFVAFR